MKLFFKKKMTKFNYKIGCSLMLQPYSILLKLLHILKIQPLDCMFFTFLIHMSNFVSIVYFFII